VGIILKTLNVKQRLDFASRGVDVLRTLESNKQKMQCEEFAKAIGLMAKTDTWTVQHSSKLQLS
jgi:hypothetical protein